MTINTDTHLNSLVKTRFAPSPTGFMHIGNLRTALFSYLFAIRHNGQFLLRIEDTDLARSKPIYTDSLLTVLKTLGLNWQELVYQSQRLDIYEQFYTKLMQQDLIYRCFCSEDQLNLARKVQLAQGLPPRYAGTCLQLTKAQVAQKLANNESACWRFKVPKGVQIVFEDLIKGKQTFNSNDFGDFIVKRQDGSPAFMFCSVIDDVLQGVTHVLRGADHVSNTPRQLLLLQALGLTPPKYGHFPLLNSGEGELKLSKRSGSQSIEDLLAAGFLPQAILNYLARLGHSYTTKENSLLTLDDLATEFELSHISSHAARHDLAHLNFWQKQAMLQMNNSELLEILRQSEEFNKIIKNHSTELQDFIELMKANILMPNEAIKWAKALFSDSWFKLDVATELKSYLQKLDRKILEIIAEIVDFESGCAQLKAAGFSAKDLFMTLRIILTGLTAGPELPKLFALVGAAKLRARAKEIITNVKNL